MYLIDVDNKLLSRCINKPENTLEIVIVLIKFDNKNVIISSVYFPNKASIDIIYTKYFYVINDIYYNYPNSDFILLGDFNIPFAISTNTKKFFNDNISFLDMYQFNNISNSKNDIHVYVISNNNSLNVTLNKFPVVNVDSYHPPLETSCDISLKN